MPRPLAIAPLNTPSSPHAAAIPTQRRQKERKNPPILRPSTTTCTLLLLTSHQPIPHPSVVINQEGVCFESIFIDMSISISSILRIQKQFTRLQRDRRVGKESILEVKKKKKRSNDAKAEPDCHRLFSSYKQRQTPKFAGPFIIPSPSIRGQIPACLWPNDQLSSVRSRLVTIYFGTHGYRHSKAAG